MLYFERTAEQLALLKHDYGIPSYMLFGIAIVLVMALLVLLVSGEVDTISKLIAEVFLFCLACSIFYIGYRVDIAGDPNYEYIEDSLTETPNDNIISYGKYNGTFHGALEDALNRYPNYETRGREPFYVYDVTAGEEEWNEVREIKDKYYTVTVFIKHLKESTTEANPWQGRTADK